jgi:hypothetical protein
MNAKFDFSCGLWLTGVGGTATYESTGSSCVSWNDWRSWSPELKSNISNFVLAEMDALQNYMFWTWKIGVPKTTQDWPSSPFWHYKLGREQGWIPRDPRDAVGMCQSVGVGGDQFQGVFPSSAIGEVRNCSFLIQLAERSGITLLLLSGRRCYGDRRRRQLFLVATSDDWTFACIRRCTDRFDAYFHPDRAAQNARTAEAKRWHCYWQRLG